MSALEDLRERLARAERDWVCADMIDSFPRRERETARCKAVVESLKREIAAIDPINLQGSGPAPIEAREG